jgi:hypothetical protein
MTIQDITFLKSASPVVLLDKKPSPETVELVSKIISRPDFNQFTAVIRQMYKFPEAGLDIKKYIGRKIGQTADIITDTTVWTIYMTVNEVKRTLDPDDGPIDQLLLIVIFNAFIDLDYFTGSISRSIEFIVGKKEIASAMYDFPHEAGAIMLSYSTSKRQLHKWIDNNWESMEKKMDSKLLKNPWLIRVHRNTEIGIEIIDLKDNKHKSFSEISTILTDKYPEDLRVTDEVWIKDNYYIAKEHSLHKLASAFE